jgi:hypothetical protein
MCFISTAVRLSNVFATADLFNLDVDDDTLTLEDAACGYKALLVIEQGF